jgi:hypothetical protein
VDDIRIGFGDAGGHRADAGFRNELDRNASARIDLPEIIDELREVLFG